MRLRERVRRFERARGPVGGKGPLPLHIISIIMDAGDSGRPLTSAERQELDRHKEAIGRVVSGPKEKPDFRM